MSRLRSTAIRFSVPASSSENSHSISISRDLLLWIGCRKKRRTGLRDFTEHRQLDGALGRLLALVGELPWIPASNQPLEIRKKDVGQPIHAHDMSGHRRGSFDSQIRGHVQARQEFLRHCWARSAEIMVRTPNSRCNDSVSYRTT